MFRTPRSRRRCLVGLNALLMTSAFTLPAFAQEIETMIITAEKKAEDIQSVPIAVTAFSAQDLADHQITQFKDLQYATPNVNYTKSNFTASNFQIRGIGTQIFATDSEFGVAFNVDDVFYSTAPVDSAQFYDIADVEVLRGPQSTLYGRGATGGAVNVTTARPKLDEFATDGYVSYANYNGAEIRGMVNLPVIDDELGIRVAGDWVRHDGFTHNIYPGAHSADGRDMWSIRASVRWQPSDSTTIDLIGSTGDEADSRMRAQKQLCNTDPTGILGCLPTQSAGNSGPVNLNATFLAIPVSRQALGLAFTPLYTQLLQLQGYTPSQAQAAAPGAAAGLGITDLSAPFSAPANAVPSDPRTINSDFTPYMHNRSYSVTLQAKQKINDWLSATFVANYADFNLLSQESFVNSPGQAFDPTLLATSLGTFQNTIGAYALGGYVPASYASPTTGPYGFILNPSHAGTLPTSNFNNLGIIGGSINRYTSNQFAYDQSDGQGKQNTLELRFASDLPGPINFLAALYYLHADSPTDYYVGANTLDYGQALIGALKGPLPTSLGGAGSYCGNATGCIFGTPYYHNDGVLGSIDSKAVYGEVYYDVIPDTLKLTGGLRYTEDLKHYTGRIAIFNGVIPIGTTDENAALNGLVSSGQADFDSVAPNNPLGQDYQMTKRKFDKLTGRAVVTWTPKTDFTDATMVYASYSRGYKAGGSNPGVQSTNLQGIQQTYAPEGVDAYELGTKNTLMNGTLQANVTLWHYDYYNYQISQIVANTAATTSVNAKLSGIEAEFKIAASDRLEFSLNGDITNSAIGNSSAIDTRNPTGGNPNTLLIKDGTLSPTNAGNCVLYYNGSNFNADFAALQSASQGLFYAPPGGQAALAGAGVAHAAYGSCYGGTSAADPFYALSLNNPGVAALLAGTNFSQSNPAINGTLTGVPVSLKGRHLSLVSPGSISVGAQYTQPLDSGFALIGHVDWYWQAAMFGQIFNDPADRIMSYGVGNMQLTLVAPEHNWQIQGFIRNVFNSNNITGEYLAAPTQGLFTGAFYGDPRMYGIAASVNF